MGKFGNDYEGFGSNLKNSGWDIERIIEEGVLGHLQETSSEDWMYIEDQLLGTHIQNIDLEYLSIRPEEE